jgi:NAD(P)-dependent dehydrogenase (short-subunit alcohol dehydrogenase family)
MSDFILEGKTIFVTGSSRGLGWAMAQACANSGANVILHGRSEEALAKRVDDIKNRGGRADYLAFDMKDRESVENAISTIEERHGAIWGLINNAGMLKHGFIHEQTAQDYEDILDVHLVAPFILTREASKLMMRNEGEDRGRIINIASIAVNSPRAGIGNYTSAKSAIVGFTRSMSADLGEFGIRCNAIAPGYFLTDINKERLSDQSFVDKIISRTPAKRWGEPEELGGPAVFLMSSASSYVNGQTLFVDGGMSHFS